METEKSISTVAFIVVLIIVGITAWQFGYRNSSNKNTQSYREELKAKYTGTSLVIPEGTEIKQLSGTIKSISGQTLTVSISYPRDLLGDSALDERNVTVDDNTKIMPLTMKDNAVFQKELEEYQSKIRAGESDMPSPQVFEKKIDDPLALKAGQTINIT